MIKPRSSTLFQIEYSIKLEKMTASLMGRLDRCSTFVQVLLGAAVFADAPGQKLVGVSVALLSTVSLVWQPGARSSQAATQKAKYESLLARSPELDDDALSRAFLELQASDSAALGSLCVPAHVGVEIANGFTPSATRLSFLETISSWMAGDYPAFPKRT